MSNIFLEFRNAIFASGLEPPEVIEPGKLHRFPGHSKRNSNRAGWCKLFEDGRGGCFGDWSTGLSITWQAKKKIPFSRSERIEFSRQVEKARAKAKADRITKQIAATNRAEIVLTLSDNEFEEHDYLNIKEIHKHNAALYNDSLALPVIDFSGTLTSLQFIDPDGKKMLLKGGRKQGCFIPVGNNLANPVRVIICEGWATGCTIAEVNPSSLVLAAIDAGNLKSVAIGARRHWPSADLIIAGDDDRLTPGNPGATKAREAAIASSAKLALPEWPDNAPDHLSDFNDLAVWKSQTSNTVIPHE